MKRAPKIISIIFLVITGLLTLQQAVIGNPFSDEIPPVITLSLFLVIGSFCAYHIFAHAK